MYLLFENHKCFDGFCVPFVKKLGLQQKIKQKQAKNIKMTGSASIIINIILTLMTKVFCYLYSLSLFSCFGLDIEGIRANRVMTLESLPPPTTIIECSLFCLSPQHGKKMSIINSVSIFVIIWQVLLFSLFTNLGLW